MALAVPSVSRAAGNVYVTNQGSGNVSQYAIGAGGFLSVLGPVAAGDDPRSIAMTPNEKSAYVTNFFGNTISQYNIDPVSGGLSPKSPATVPPVSDPTASL
jgi:DNA-binding beta-propeller fold protein YncE